MSKQKQRGRPPTKEKRLAIARAVLLRILPDELTVIEKKKEPKYGAQWTSIPKNTVYLTVAEEFQVSKRWVEQAVKECLEEARGNIAAELGARLDASTTAEQWECQAKIRALIKESGVNVPDEEPGE